VAPRFDDLDYHFMDAVPNDPQRVEYAD